MRKRSLFTGVVQGEYLTPTLLAAYINKIERLINNINKMGVHVNGVKNIGDNVCR